jgi:hypothetical protein
VARGAPTAPRPADGQGEMLRRVDGALLLRETRRERERSRWVQNPSGSFTKIAVIRPGVTARLMTRTLFTPLGTP